MPDNENNNNNNDAHIVEELVLPRPDWYDTEGRIYKDALIENFNTIEAKLLELTRLDAFSVQPPDLSSIDYPDVTDITTADDRSILNLKSFLDLTGLMGYPLECEFSGTVAKKVSFYASDYTYTTIKDFETGANTNNCYVYLDYVNKQIKVNGIEDTPSNCSFIGVYESGIIRCVNEKDNISINPLYYLARMSKEAHYVRTDKGTRDKYSCYDGVGSNGRLWGACDTNTKTSGYNDIYFLDVGRYSE